jgi:drug/metabolite transporter (DMT)-like permease
MTFDRVAAEAILKLAFFASCGAFILLSYSVSLIGVTKANLFANLIPALTALFAFFTIGEMITIEKFLGIAVMIAGLYMAQITKFRKLPTLWRSARYNRE